LVDEVDQAENLSELQSGGENPPEVEELEDQEGINELESLLAQKDEELARTNSRLIELEQVVAGKDSEIAGLNLTRDGLEERMTALNDSLGAAVASYKTVVVQANPEVIEELINGETIESINDSLEKAKALVSKVRQGVESEISLARIPAGAPERTSPDLSALSPREKIQYAIGKMK